MKKCSSAAKAALKVRRVFGGIARAFVAIAALAFTGAAWAGDDYVEVDGIRWYYDPCGDNKCSIRFSDTEAAVYPKPSGEVTVPFRLNGMEVSHIGSHAFYKCTDITKVTIPSTVYSIGESAFEDCSKLDTVNIQGATMQTISAYAFKNCSSLRMMTLPDSITAIGQDAFEKCTSLSAMSLPKGLKAVGGALFCNCTSLLKVTVPEGVTSIGVNAFANCSSLETVILPHSFINDDGLADKAFGGTPETLKIMYAHTYKTGGYAWEFHVDKAVGSATIESVESNRGTPAVSPVPEGGVLAVPSTVKAGTTAYTVKAIGMYALSGLSGITGVTLPSTLTSIGSYAFNNCRNITSITIPNTVTTIGMGAFSGCANLTEVTIPASVTSVAVGAFRDCTKLRRAYVKSDALLQSIDVEKVFPNTATEFKCLATEVVDGRTWYYSTSSRGSCVEGLDHSASLREVTIPSTLGGRPVVSIGSRAFARDPSLERITVPSGVTDIRNSAFEYSYVQYVYVPDTLEQIGQYAFRGCSSLRSIPLPASLDAILDGAFEGCSSASITSIRIPDSVTVLSKGAFTGCSKLKSVILPRDLWYSNIKDKVFSGCSNELTIRRSFKASHGLTDYMCVETADFKAQIGDGTGPAIATTTARDLYLPERVEITPGVYIKVVSIAKDAFIGCNRLTSVQISEYVTEIGGRAFKNCHAMKSVEIPSGVKTIGDEAFYGSGITSLDVPSTVTSVGKKAFSFCPALKTASLGYNVKEYPEELFRGCTSLSEHSFSIYVKSIGESAFKGCTSLKKISTPPSATIGYGAFADCTSLVSAILPEQFYSTSLDTCKSLIARLFANHKAGMELGFYWWQTTPPDQRAEPDFRKSVINGEFWNYTVVGGKAVIGTTLVSRSAVTPDDPTGWLTIPETLGGYPVAEIGKGAFKNCTGITGVTFPGTVTAVHDSAFEGCSGISGVTLPAGLTQIGANAFKGCTKLASVTIPAGVEKDKLGANAFYGCSALKWAYLPKQFAAGFTESSVFGGCHDDLVCLVSFDDGYQQGYVQTVNNVKWYFIPISHDLEVEIVACELLGTTTLNVPATLSGKPVTSIGDDAFMYSEITGVTLPSSVKWIGDYAFQYCTDLLQVVLPNSVIEIGTCSFEGCTSLKQFTLSRNLKKIPPSAFFGCSSLFEVYNCDNLTEIGPFAFYHCPKLMSEAVGSLIANGPSVGENAFGFAGLTSRSGTLTIPDSMAPASIAKNAFAYSYCSVLSLPESFFGKFDKSAAFYGVPSTMEVMYRFSDGSFARVVDGVTWRYTTATGYKATVTGTDSTADSLTVPAKFGSYTVTAIGAKAFKDNTKLTWVTLPDSVTDIGAGAFSGCTSLNKTGISSTSNVKTIGANAYSGCGLPTVTLPDTVTSLGKDAFKDSAGLYKASLPGSLYGTANIFSYWFSGCADNLVVTFRREEGDYMAQVVNGYTWYYQNSASGSGVTITHFIEPQPTGTITIPSKLGGKTVDAIATYAFKDYTGITSVIIPSTVKTIERNAFQGCTGLTSVSIPRSVTSIADYAFNGCSNLASASLPDTLNGIDESKVFQGCASGINVTYRDKGGRTSVVVGGKTWWYRVVDGGAEIFYADPYASKGDPDYATDWKPAVEPVPTGSLTIPASLNGYPVTKIGKYAFSECAEMTSVTIPDSVTEIDYEAFGGCWELATVNFGTGLKTIGEYAFDACGELASLDLPDGLTSIENSAFNGCHSLTSLVIPDSVNKLGVNAFSSCSGLTSVILPEGLTDIGYMPFYRCSSLTDVTLKTEAAVNSFIRVFDRSYVKNVTIAEGVTAIGDQAFCYNRNEEDHYVALESVTLPESLESIGAYAFRWSKLKSLTIPRSVTSIGKYAFADCAKLTSVSIPAHLAGENVGECAFMNCTGLTSVTFEDGATSIGATSMFSTCSGLTSVEVPDGVVSIIDRTFDHCYSLQTLTIPQSVQSVGANVFRSAGLATVNVAARDTARVKAMLVDSGLEESFVNGLTFVEALPDFWFVRFDGNGGAASATQYDVAPNTALGELPTATRANYDFLGWFTEAEGGDKISAATKATADVTYYAHWKIKQYTVTIDTGAGSTPVVVDHGTTVGDIIDAQPVPTREGYEFKGWVDDDDQPLDLSAVVTADFSFHAVWAKRVKVNGLACFDGVEQPSGVWSAQLDGVEGDELDLPVQAIDGYVFLGWSAEPDGELLPGYVVATEGLTLYAQFELDAWIVTFDANDGTCDTASVKVAKGQKLDSLPEATRIGFVQNGWWTAADGGEQIVANWTEITGDLTAYAHWTPVATEDGYTYTYQIEDGKATIHEDRGLVAVDPWPTGVYEIPSVLGGTPVGKIGHGAFAGVSITELVIPDGVTEIGSGAFNMCQSLTTVTLPKSVTTIGMAAFGGCDALATFNVEYGDTARVKAMLVDSGLNSAFVDGLTFNEAPAPTHTVSFDPIGGTVDPAVIAVEEGSKIGALLPTPVWAGHGFDGWFTSGGDEITADTEVTADISCFAVWTDLNYYAVTLVPNDGVCDKDVIWAYDGSPIGELPVPTRVGYMFDGWWTEYEGGTKVSADFIVTGDGTIFAHWTEVAPDVVVVTFNGNGGTLAEGDEIRTLFKDGAVGDLPAATRTGYTLDGWWTEAVGGERVTASTTVSTDATYYARWTPNVYDVVFESNGTTLIAISVTYDSAYSTDDFPVPTYAGHDFAGWFTEAEGGVQVYPSDVVKITETQTLYAHWTETPPPPPETFTVTFNGNGAPNPAPRTVENGAAIGDLPVLTLEGYDFLGWFTTLDGDVEVTATTTVTGNMTIYAHWRSTSGKHLDPYGVEWSYVIVDGHAEIYKGYGEAAIPADTVGEVTVPAEIDGYPVTAIGDYAFQLCAGLSGVTIPGGIASIGKYAFQGCTSIESLIIPSTMAYIGEGAFANCDLLATVTYLGSCPDTGDYIYYGDAAFEASIVPDTGWETEVEAGEWQSNPIRVATAPTWTYTFDATDGVCAETTRAVEQGEPIGELPLATREGYDFDGWWSNPVGGWQIQPTDVISGDMTIYAHWTEVESTTWTVSFYAMGGTIVGDDTKLVEKNQMIGALPEVTREGYTFGGWWTGPDGSGIQYQADYAVTEDLYLYAYWTEIPPTTWTITFDANGGACDETPRNVVDGQSLDTLPEATLTGYTLDGWFTEAEGGERVFIYSTISADATYYAHWTPNTYRVTFVNEGGDPVYPDFKDVTFDAAYGELPTPSNGTKLFVGWYTAAEGGTDVNADTIVATASDHSLYARWTEGGGSGDYEVGGYTLTIDVDKLGRAMLFKPNPELGYAEDHPQYFDFGVCAIDPKPEGEYKLPATIGGYPLKFIGVQAFRGCTDLTGVVIPDGVETIEAYAFEGCYNMKTISIPSSVGYIGYMAFTPGLKVVYVDSPEAREKVIQMFTDVDTGVDPSKIAFIDKSTPLSTVTFEPANGEASFTQDYANGLEIGELPVPTRAGFTFNGWFTENVYYRTRVSWDYVVSSDITLYAMWTVTEGVQSAVVGDYTWYFKFDGKNAIIYNNGNAAVEFRPTGHIDVPAKLGTYTVTGIGNRAFVGLDKVTSVKIPDGVKVIGRYAFQGCEALQCVDVGKGVAPAAKSDVENIDLGAFADCSVLKAVQFRGAAMPICSGGDIFDGTPANCKVYVAKNAKNWPLTTWLDKEIVRDDYKVNVPVYVMSGAEPGCKSLSGAGLYALGKKVTLKATAASGYVFSGWYDALDGSGRYVSRATSYSYIVTGEDVEFNADFATLWDDESSLDCFFADTVFETEPDGTFTLDLDANTASCSEPKASFKNLPTGLKYDAKTFKIAGKATKPGKYKVTLSLSNATVRKAKTYDFYIKVPNFYDPIVAVVDEYGPYIPGVEYTETFDVSAGDWAVTGLPTGMKWTNKAIVDTKTKEVKVEANSIYGAPSKPGSYTVYFTKTMKEVDEKTGRQVSVKHVSTATFTVSDFPVLTLEMDGYGYGKVTGAGAYPANKKVSLKATPNNAGSVFNGWYLEPYKGDGTDFPISQAASFSYDMPEYDTTLYAHFITAAEDKAGIWTIFNNEITFIDDVVSMTKSIPCGVYLEWPLDVNALSLPTVKVAGLPAGLKFAAKDVIDSKTKEVIVPANTIYGTPTAASKVDARTGAVKPSEIKITITTAGKSTVNYIVTTTVDPMQDWAVGTFEGSATEGDGLATITVASTGKISGKSIYGGLTWTLTGAYFDEYDDYANRYTATITGKSGQATFTEKLTLFKNEDVGGFAMVGESPATVAEVVQYNWKAEPWKSISANFGGALSFGKDVDEACPGTVKLTFKKNTGAVAIQGQFGSYKATASANLTPITLPGEKNRFFSYLQVYFPPNAQKGFAGYGICLPLTWTGSAFVIGLIP